MRRRIGPWIVADLMVFVFALFPVFWLGMLSLKDPATVSDGRLIPSKWSTASYSSIFKSDEFTRALINSVGIALISTVLAVVLASMAAYAIARLAFPGKRLMLGAALALAIFPPIAIVGPLVNMWRNLGLYDTWPGLIIPYMTFTLPLAIYTLSAFFREIPWELEQAAQVDGATPFQAFTKVILPLAAPGVFTTAILVFIYAWNDFVFALSLTSTTRAQTVPPAIQSFTGVSQFTAPTGAIAAAAIIVTIPIVIMVLFFQRRMVAGLEDITEGELIIDGQVVNDRAPKDRDIAMVFQSYALYPHMTVGENMAFPLRLAKVPDAEVEQRVGEAAKILDLEQHLDRKPANLSGGQRQRVAMGRAIVRNPKAFLMDEPLSNLDAKLRVQTRAEVARLQQRLGTTMVYVTHDPTEALTPGDP